ncbi:sugar transferase [Nostoc sphaeroides]|uniref:Sugar transferase involved in LPS biosynthesis n=1 Tax=Nostoc sphaeroides CCNUC1 TaxID=2653204 RepID=A0A5P8W5G2_9NOSO|nr:sugar transferase [Nostoc sphaeroides]QFS47968.1 Sugar transferase involved in LPS biosynthesis [Nostoc sphaeroides CCNUC1]
MSNQSITTSKFSEVPLDLRASSFARVRKGSWWLRLTTLFLVDSSLLLLAWVLAGYQSYHEHFTSYIQSHYLPILITIGIQIGSLAIEGIYREGQKRYDYLNIIKSLTFAHGLILLISFLYKPVIDVTRPRIILLSWLLSILFICTGRYAINITLEYLRKQKKIVRSSVFIICDPQDHEQIASFIKKEKHYIVSGTAHANSLDRYKRQQTLNQLNELGVTEVFISWDALKNRMFLCWLFQASGIQVHILPMELKPIYKNIEFNKIGGMPCLSLDCPIITGKDFWIKRSSDFLFATLFVMLSFPIYIAIAIAIKLDSPGTVFYRQTRIGLHGQQFKVWKFRTMRSDAEKFQKELEALNETKDGIIFKIKDDPRITRVGKFLRRYSLDELPQLFNVIFGEMSIVGPRPLPTRDVDKFSEHHFIRHEVLPGITGLWQVSGRSDILDFEQVINLDLNYIENWSLRLDFEILLKTVMVVLKKEGAY